MFCKLITGARYRGSYCAETQAIVRVLMVPFSGEDIRGLDAPMGDGISLDSIVYSKFRKSKGVWKVTCCSKDYG